MATSKSDPISNSSDQNKVFSAPPSGAGDSYGGMNCFSPVQAQILGVLAWLYPLYNKIQEDNSEFYKLMNSATESTIHSQATATISAANCNAAATNWQAVGAFAGAGVTAATLVGTGISSSSEEGNLKTQNNELANLNKAQGLTPPAADSGSGVSPRATTVGMSSSARDMVNGDTNYNDPSVTKEGLQANVDNGMQPEDYTKFKTNLQSQLTAKQEQITATQSRISSNQQKWGSFNQIASGLTSGTAQCFQASWQKLQGQEQAVQGTAQAETGQEVSAAGICQQAVQQKYETGLQLMNALYGAVRNLYSAA